MPIKKASVSSADALAEKRRLQGLPPPPEAPADQPAKRPDPIGASVASEPAEPPAGDVEATPEPAIEPTPEAVAAPATPSPRRPKPRSPAATAPDPSVPKATEFLTLIAALPAPGVSDAFDTLSADMGAAKALQAILRRALDDYEAALLDGDGPRAVKDYTKTENEVRTSRHFQAAALAIARQTFDPFDVISKADLGRKIANAALSLYFARQKKRSH